MHKIGAHKPKTAVAVTDYSASFNQFIYDAVPSNTRCLDVGCFSGNLGSALRDAKGCTVDGIELNSQAAAIAKNRGYDNVFVLDLNHDLAALPNESEKYDVITCADVLEHLIAPEQVLERLSGLLKPGGIFIISLPNVAFLLNRLHLLLGNWDYKQYGILDRTHLRFYTIKTGCRMVESAGLKIAALKPYNQFGALRRISPLDKWFPSLLAYQFLVIAKRVAD